jgi:glyoxylase-like metal-dependent hydrolase (beta-lactamase superfamily II)
MRRIPLLCLVLLSPFATAADLVLKPVEVAPRVYAVIGDLAGQTYENEGLNANLGFVVGTNGVLVINTGPSDRVARALHRSIRKITNKPVKWVINVNGQNHYWHGNSYFRQLGARIHAHPEAIRLMQEQGAGQLDSNRNTLKERAAGTVLAYPDQAVQHRQTLDLGGTTVEVLHYGTAHTPGDIALWIPADRIVFTGDLMYTERLLALLPIGSSEGWVRAFDQLAALPARVVVPGHGHPTTFERGRRDTRDYIAFLRAEAKRIFDAGGSLQDAVEKVDQSRFKSLANFDQLALRNMNQAFQEIEKELF